MQIHAPSLTDCRGSDRSGLFEGHAKYFKALAPLTPAVSIVLERRAPAALVPGRSAQMARRGPCTTYPQGSRQKTLRNDPSASSKRKQLIFLSHAEQQAATEVPC